MLQSVKIASNAYMDDMAFLGDSPRECQSPLSYFGTFFCFYGMSLNSKKCMYQCRAVPPRPCLGSIAVHDIRCTTATPFIKGCLTEAILIPHMNHAANVSLDTKRIIT
jgi:hypothetical protein